MLDSDIRYPSIEHKNYLEEVYEYCKRNNFSMLLKGSLSNNTSTKYSDIDLVLLGIDINEKIDDLIAIHGKPVMTNFTTNPKGIIILIYEDGLCIDMDIRETISHEELKESKVLLEVNEKFIISNENITRSEITSTLLPNRPMWYKILRLVHRGTIKYVSNKPKSALNLLSEIKKNIYVLGIYDLQLEDNFEDDIQIIFSEICNKFKVDIDIQYMFQNLFKEFKNH